MCLQIYHFDKWIKTAGLAKPRKAFKMPDLSWQKRYKEAYYNWQKKQYGEVKVQVMPDTSAKTKHDQLEKQADFYVKWIGGKAIQTPTKGTPLYKETVIGGKIKREINGYGRAKGGKGKMDTLIIYKGVSFLVDWKVGKDYQKEAQGKFQSGVESAGGVYLLLHSMHDLYAVIDWIDSGKDLILFDNILKGK